jgi:SAM-dependent methyltransferase
LTQALARYFEHVIGVDVSHVMLEHASRLNGHGGRVKYVLNESDSLAVLGDARFDLIYTDLVLQHLPPNLATKYVRELLALMSPGGLFVFQLPSHRRAAQQTAPSPLEESAYKATIELLGGQWFKCASSEFTLRVINAGSAAWDPGVFRLGNHWLTESRAMLVQDDARVSVPTPFPSGASTVLAITPGTPPRDAGILEFDVVHEGVTWFADRGSSTLQVRPADVIASSSETAFVPERHHLSVSGISQDESVAFPMYGVPRAEVERAIAEAGTQLVLAEVDERGGPEWEGYRYFVTRRH